MAVAVSRRSVLRPPLGLLLSIGDTREAKNRRGETIEIPTRLDHFRPKPGQLGQYATAAEKFASVYGPEPKELEDLYFLSNLAHDVLDVRLRCWSKTGLRGVGMTNYATLPPDEFEARAWSFEDEFLYFPKEAKEVRADRRDAWQGEPIEGHLDGRDDPRIEKLGIALEGSLSFCLPEVMGIGRVAQITSKGRRSIRNLYQGVRDLERAFGGLMGFSFRLAVRPARTQRYDADKRSMVAVEFFELVIDTPLTVAEIFASLRERREALTTTERLALPAGSVVSGDGSGYALPPIDMDALEQQARANEATTLPTVEVAPPIMVEEPAEPVEGEVVDEDGQLFRAPALKPESAP